MPIPLGVTAIDKITKFRGVVVGYVSYISGCNQALLTPEVGGDNRSSESAWFDEQRLLIDHATPRVILDNGTNPGFDKPAPKR